MYQVQNFSPIHISTSTILEVNTNMIVLVTRTSNAQQFTFQSYKGYIDLGKFLFFKNNFLESSSLSGGKPIKSHLLKKKFIPDGTPYPVLSTVFWESLMTHYYKEPAPRVILDLVPGKFFHLYFLN